MAVAVIAFCMALILLALLAPGIDGETRRTAINTAFVCLGAVPSSYTWAVVADYKHQRTIAAAKPPEAA